jgi:hypothetical protein
MSSNPAPQSPQAAELKPCPWTHTGNQTDSVLPVQQDDGDWRVRCEHCEARGPWGVTRDAAIAAWNRRAPALPALARDEQGEMARFVARLRSYWSFDEAQQHTHSWHDRENFIERLPEMLPDFPAAPGWQTVTLDRASWCDDSDTDTYLCESASGSKMICLGRALYDGCRSGSALGWRYMPWPSTPGART